jgi:hypothetical protein
MPFRLFSKILGGKSSAGIIVPGYKFTANVNDAGGHPELTNIVASLEKKIDKALPG